MTLYPHPMGRLGLVAVRGSGSWEDIQRMSYDSAMPVLDELSARYDVPLPVAHVISVGMPSGLIHLYYPSPPKEKEIAPNDEVLPRCPHPELRAAYALYREAVSSNNPFHAFLIFWKVWEEALYVRKGRGARLKRSDTRVREEVFPDQFAFGAKPEELADPSRHPGEEDEERLRGEPFSKARDVLNGPYRVALAHAGRVDAGQALTGATFDHYDRVADKVPVIRYVANVVLENLRATFNADVEAEAAEAPEGSGVGNAESR
ncbi:MAG TPA: methylamine utilization protein MauJ [Rubrobacter sp.]|nr:methylamine utilization protein MauJ [Rubrobacter sp.]